MSCCGRSARAETPDAHRRWARSRATTISPPTSSTATSRPAAPTSRPSSIRAAPGPTASSPTASRALPRCLRALGVRREERVLIALLDTIDWPTAFLGCLKAGVVAVPVNTLMTEDDYRFMLADSRARVLVVSEALYPRFQKLIGESADLEHVIVSGDNAQGHKRFEDLIDGAMAEAHDRADRARRHRVLALHLGLDRQAQGRGACPRRSEAHRRSLRRAVSQHHRERRLLFGGEAVLRLWARQCADLPDVGRRLHGAAAGPADAGWRRGAAAPASGHGVLRGADVLCGVPGKPRRAAARRDEIPLLRLGRRGAAGRCRQALARPLRRRHPRRHRLDRDAAHLPVQPRRRGEVRHHRQAGAGLRHQARRRRRRAGEEGRDGRAAGVAARPAR